MLIIKLFCEYKIIVTLSIRYKSLRKRIAIINFKYVAQYYLWINYIAYCRISIFIKMARLSDSSSSIPRNSNMS